MSSESDANKAILKLILWLGYFIATPILVTAIGVTVMVYGWGIQPQNWYVILGGAVASYTMIFSSSMLRALTE